ncbi:MAG: hypothetical protein AAF196_06910 [Planctomycetota bacterium]
MEDSLSGDRSRRVVVRQTVLAFAIVCLGAVRSTGQEDPVALPAGNLVVLGMGDGSIFVIDTARGETRAELSTDVVPHEVCVSPDGDQAFVMLYGNQTPGHEVLPLDLGGENVELGDPIDLGGLARPHGCMSDTGGVWFTSEVARAVAHVDAETGRIDRVIGHGARGGHMLTLDRPRDRVYVTAIYDREVSCLDLQGQGPVRRCVLEDQAPEGIGLSADGRSILAAHRGVGVLSIVDTDQMTLRSRLEIGGDPFRILCPRDRPAVVGDPGGSRLVLVDVGEARVVGEIALPGAPAGIALSPDQRFLAASLFTMAKVVIVDLESREVVREFEVGANPDGIFWGAPAGTSPPDPKPRGRLGIALAPVGEAERERLLFEGEGALLARVEAGSPAEAQGLEVGMIVVACDEVPVRDPYVFIELMKGRLAGDRLTLDVVDLEGELRTIEIELGGGA